MKASITLSLLATALLMSACAEKAQTAATRKFDTKPWEGAQPGYTAAGWKSGDQASWEEQMKTRSRCPLRRRQDSGVALICGNQGHGPPVGL